MIKKKPNFVDYLTYLFGKYGIDFTTEESEKELVMIINKLRESMTLKSLL